MTGAVLWLLIIGSSAAIAAWLWHARRKWLERKRAEEERLASFVGQVAGGAPRGAAPVLPVQASRTEIPSARAEPPAAGIAQQKLLFDAAAKAAEAGESALAIQLYARLLARYPDSGLREGARAAVEKLKPRLATARNPGTDGPG